MMVMPETRCAH